MNPRKEAEQASGGRYDVRVFEPSPPAIDEPPYVEDPNAPSTEGGLPVLGPTSAADVLWDDLARDDAALAEFCTPRWLGAYRRFDPVPATFAETRASLHRLAEHVISPTRQRANGEITLRFTRGGFGTPFFGNDVQLRVAGDALVVQVGEKVQSGHITSLKDAAEFVGFDLTRFDVAAAEDRLPVDAASANYLGDVYGFAFNVLEQLRAEQPPEMEASLVNMWPEHFDVGLDLGSESDGRRAGFGISPGDGHHPEPYVYVAPWNPPPEGDLWQAVGFKGAELLWSELLEAEDQRAAALEFFRTRLVALNA